MLISKQATMVWCSFRASLIWFAILCWRCWR